MDPRPSREFKACNRGSSGIRDDHRCDCSAHTNAATKPGHNQRAWSDSSNHARYQVISRMQLARRHVCIATRLKTKRLYCRRHCDRDAPLGLAQRDGVGHGLSPRTSPRPPRPAMRRRSQATPPATCLRTFPGGLRIMASKPVLRRPFSLQTDWGPVGSCGYRFVGPQAPHAAHRQTVDPIVTAATDARMGCALNLGLWPKWRRQFSCGDLPLHNRIGSL